MAWTKIKEQTASNAANVSFIDGTSDVVLDNTYKLYRFCLYDINPATNLAEFTFQFNAAGASGFNETITSTMFKAHHDEADSATGVDIAADEDQAQGTAYNYLFRDGGNGADESCAGELYIFNPSSTTYVTHWYSWFNGYQADNYSINSFAAGYVNATAAMDEVDFKMSTGNMDGVISLWGL